MFSTRTAKRATVSAVLAALAACGAVEGEHDDALAQEAAAPSAALTRDNLKTVTERLLGALQSKSLDGVLAADAKVTENGAAIAASASQLLGAKSYPYQVFFAEPGARTAGVFAVADVGTSPAVFSARIKVAGGQISELELITARTGEAVIVAPQLLKAPDAMYESLVPAEQRTARAAMIAAANAYFDGIEQADGSKVPFADSCNRVENGVQSTNNPSLSPLTSLGCRDGIPLLSYIKKVRDRRYPVVDEERGLIWSEVMFDIPAGHFRAEVGGQVIEREQPAGGMFISEVFKIVSGKITRLEAVIRNAPLGQPSGWPTTP